MRITVELIQRSHQALNALREREICLRGQKIVAIENLGATLDQFEVIDLSNNEIIKLEDSAPLRAITSLIFSNNEICKISPTFGKNFPRLENLVLTGNKIKDLAQIDNLSNCKVLKRLSLVNNFVTSVPNYRLYTIFKLPTVTVLDFQKVKLKERNMAQEMFGKEEELEDVIEKKRKIDENRAVRKPVEIPHYLKTQEESLNFTS